MLSRIKLLSINDKRHCEETNTLKSQYGVLLIEIEKLNQMRPEQVLVVCFCIHFITKTKTKFELSTNG